jgi:hypothetical protein
MAQRRNVSEPLREAFVAEVAARFPNGRSPSGHRFDDGRWFAGSEPVLEDPYVIFDEDNIMVGSGTGYAHEHFFPAGDDADSLRAAAGAALDALQGIEGVTNPARPLSERRATGARLGAVLGGAAWVGMMFTETLRSALSGSYVVAAVFVVGVGALTGALLLVPSR